MGLGTATLTGTIESSDDRPYYYHWISQNGIGLDDENLISPSFEITLETEQGDYMFSLVADDGNTEAVDNVTVSVKTMDDLTPSTIASGDSFGEYAVFSDDGTACIVSASWDDEAAEGCGAVYVYRYDGSSWTSEKLIPSDGQDNQRFGAALAVSADGNTILIGAYQDDDNGSSAGAAYLFTYNSSGWDERKIKASDGAAGYHFGGSLAMSSNGGVFFIGAGSDDIGTVTDAGSVYLYYYDGSSWSEKKIPNISDAKDDEFGSSTTLNPDGSVLLTGCRGDDAHLLNAGSAYAMYLNY